MTTRRRVKLGDVFSVPLTDAKSVVAQVVGVGGSGNLCFGDFGPEVQGLSVADPGMVDADRLVLIAPSLDALIWHGVWTYIGSLPVEVSPLCFRREFPHGGERVREIVSYDRRRGRPVRDEEWSRFRNDFAVAPIRVANAARVVFGYSEWDPDLFDDLLPGRFPGENEVFEPG
jgi:hypothetical protein